MKLFQSLLTSSFSLLSLISADIPGTYMANHSIEHTKTILEKQFTPSCACTYGVRIAICKPQRRTLVPAHKPAIQNSKHQHDIAVASWNISCLPPSYSARFKSLDEKMRWRKNVSSEIYNLDPSCYSSPGVVNWYSAGSSGPLRCSKSPTRKKRIASY